MLTKIFLFHVIFSLFTFLYFILTCIRAAYEIHHKYPELHSDSTPIVGVVSLFQMLMISFIPLFNMGILYVLLFHYDEFIERVKNNLTDD